MRSGRGCRDGGEDSMPSYNFKDDGYNHYRINDGQNRCDIVPCGMREEGYYVIRNW